MEAKIHFQVILDQDFLGIFPDDLLFDQILFKLMTFREIKSGRIWNYLRM